MSNPLELSRTDLANIAGYFLLSVAAAYGVGRLVWKLVFG